MTESLQRAQRQLSRRRSLRRWVPAAIVGSLASVGVGTATAWVSPQARIPLATSGRAATANPVASQLARNIAALRQASQDLATANAEISTLPRLVVTSSAGQASASSPPLPSIAPVAIPNLPPATHATTGASG
ncbi:MAG: hypothetical protein ACYCV7_16285 [Acidimicrobiales bacterium]